MIYKSKTRGRTTKYIETQKNRREREKIVHRNEPEQQAANMENDAITGRNGAAQCPSTICAAPSLDGGGARGTEGAPRRGDARSRSRSSRSRSPPLAPFILARGSDAMSGEAVRLPPYTGPPPFFIAPSCRAGGAPNEDACTWGPVGVDARPGPARCGEAEYPGPGSDPERACFPGPTGDKGRGFGLCRRTMTSAICNTDFI